jgi:uncharacterized protein (DUF2147 family)
LEVVVKKLFAVVAFVLASTAAQAQYTFEFGGHTIRIDPDRGTVSIPGIYDNSGRRSRRPRGEEDSDRPRKQTPEQAKVDPQAPAAEPARQEQAPAPTAPAAVAPSPQPSTATVAPTAPTPSTPPPTSPPAPPIQQEATRVAKPETTPVVQPRTAPVARPAPAPVVATVPPAAPAPTVQPPANSPLGVWLTEEKEGKVRIEQCGSNLCGYSVDEKTNQNGEQILINMRPGKDAKWTGRIHDPNTGSTYDSTIAMKGSDNLRVQGCAFGGLFCGGQTWSRVN